MKKILLLFAIVNFYFSTAQDSKNNSLIPRKDLFKSTARHSFKMDGRALRLYFRNDQNNNIIYHCKAENSQQIDSVIFKGQVLQFEPSKNDLLVIWKDSLLHLMLDNQEIKLPASTQSVQFITNLRSNQKIALQIQSKEQKNSGIYVLNTTNKQLSKKADFPPVSTIFFDDNFDFIAGNVNNNEGGISMYYYKNKNWKILESVPWSFDLFIGGFSKIIAASFDGKTIYYTSNLNTDKARLYQFDIATEKSKEIAQHDKIDLLPMGASLNSKGELTSVVGLYAKTLRIVVDKSAQKDFDFLDEKLEDISFAQSLDGDKKWLVREFTGSPTKFYLYDRTTQKLQYLTCEYPDLEPLVFAKRKAYEVKTRDGLSLPVHVYLPAGSDQNNDGIPDQPLPTILYVHGGPWVGVMHWNQYFHWRNFQLLANRGYAVINCEFRGATGMGKEFIDKSMKTWGTDMTNDKTDIAHWAVSTGIAAKEKVGIWGWSYGGYAAMAALAFAPETYNCAVSMYGISDLESFGKTPMVVNSFWQEYVGDASDITDSKMLAAHSPINFIDKIKAPLLLTTGSLDDRIPQVQIDSMAKAMKAAQKEVIYFYYPDEGHDYQAPESWISFWAVTEHFLKKNLGGKAEAIKRDFELGNKVVVEGQTLIDAY